MAQRKLPKKGCFAATYPDTEWREIACGAPSTHPNRPALKPRPDAVGNGADFAAQTSGLITKAEGSFPVVLGVGSESGDVSGKSPAVAGAWMLQLNTQFFSNPPACKNASGCQGWVQFLFSQSQCTPTSGQPGIKSGTVPCVFIEYWMLGFGPTCPGAPWISDGQNDCFFNTASTIVPPQNIENLGDLVLTGSTGGGQDQVILSSGGQMFAQANDSVLDLPKFWKAVEFNVFGDCCFSQAVFNEGTTLLVNAAIDDGTRNGPTCESNAGTTGETNNLFLVSPCTATGGGSPKIAFWESLGGPPAVTGPFVNTYTEHDQQHFVYLAANGDIWDAFYCPQCSSPNWRLQLINDGGATPDAPPAASLPFVNVFSGHDQQHFAYLATNESGRNGEIWDAFYCPGCSGNPWRLQKINGPGGVTNGPPAVAGPFIDTYTEHDQQHFVYLAANGVIWDAFYCPGCSGNPWRLQQINDGGVTGMGANGKPNAPPAASLPFVNVYSGHDQQHFAYLATNADGRNGEIWDAYYCPGCSGGQWKTQQINGPNSLTGGNPASAGPFVDTYTEHDQQHFAYLASNGDIWDAFYCPGCSGNTWRIQKINDGGAAPSAPASATVPFVDVFSGHDQQHFAYLALNTVAATNAIWDAFYCPGCSGASWRPQMINDGGVSTAPPAATAPFINYFTGHDQQHFAYLATNGDGRNGEIWDVFYCPGCSGSKWVKQKIAGQ